MSTAFTPERIERELLLARNYDEYDKREPARRGDRHVENRRALVEIIEQIQGELTVERTHNGALTEANQWFASVERERDAARTQLSEALREIDRLKAALRNQNTSGVA